MFDEEGDVWHFRDLLLGMNDMIINLEHALREAEKVKDRNPEAAWFLEWATDSTKGFYWLTTQFNHDARAIVYHVLGVTDFYQSFHNHRHDNTPMTRAAEMGHALAQAAMASNRNSDGAKEWALKSMAQGEREGFHSLACMTEGIDGYKLHYEAARRGHVRSARLCGERLPMENPLRWSFLSIWWPYNVSTQRFDDQAIYVTGSFLSYGDESLNPSVFEIGRIVARARAKGRDVPDYKHREARIFYEKCIKQTKIAVNCWLLVARRLRVVKDIRRMIGVMIWESKSEGLYSF